MIGRRISNFHINERIGEGGMGTVYKATDLTLNRTVAIKMLHPFLVNNETSLKRFTNEAHLSAKISHPNVATLFDFQHYNDSHFIIMEYVTGHSLDHVLKIQGKLADKEAVKICLQVLEGLGAAHELGIMHRDLKPGNIMITKRGFVKLMDFGIARLEDSERMTKQNSVIGTLDYLSPELVKGLAPTKASDLYAVGVMLYEMLTGKTLYSGDSGPALMYQIAYQQPDLKLEGVNRTLVKIIKKLTNKQVSKRYRTTKEVIEDLERIHPAGKVNPIILIKKLEREKIKEISTFKLPLTFSLPSFDYIKKLKLPFEFDFKILGIALFLCVLILLAGVGSSTNTDGDISTTNLPEENVQSNLDEGYNQAKTSYPGQSIRNPDKAKPEIEFIEKFEDIIPEEKPPQEKQIEDKSKKEKQSKSSGKKKNIDKGKSPDTKSEEKDALQKEDEQGKVEKKEEKEQISKGATEEKDIISERDKAEKNKTNQRADQSVKVWFPDVYLSASFIETVSSEKNSEDQIVYLTVNKDVFQGEHLIVEKGAKISARINKLRRAGRKKAFLSIELLKVKAVNDKWLELSYPEYSNISKTEVEFKKGVQLSKIKLKSTTITIKN